LLLPGDCLQILRQLFPLVIPPTMWEILPWHSPLIQQTGSDHLKKMADEGLSTYYLYLILNWVEGTGSQISN